MPPPAAAVDEPLADDAIFDDGVKTVLFRRPEGEESDTGDWPPAPPTRGAQQNILEFAQIYAGYLNSLLEALAAPDELSEHQRKLLAEMCARTNLETQQHLSHLQTAVMEALMGKDVDRMKVLSSAKNAIHDKQQQIKVESAKLGITVSAAAAAAAVATAAAAAPVAGTTSGIKKADQKSELTRAAEAKRAAAEAAEKAAQKEELQQKKEQQQQQKKKPGAPQLVRPGATSASSARKGGAGGGRSVPAWALVLVVLVVVGAGVLGYFWLSSPKPIVSRGSNAAPEMKAATLQQTVAGIVATPLAADKEGDSIFFSLRWWVNNVVVAGQTRALLAPEYYQVGNAVRAEVTPADQNGNGLPLISATLTVQARIPTAPPSAKTPPSSTPPPPEPFAPAPPPPTEAPPAGASPAATTPPAGGTPAAMPPATPPAAAPPPAAGAPAAAPSPGAPKSEPGAGPR